MRRTGKFITPEELAGLRVEQEATGMWALGGRPMSDPHAEVRRLCEKYGMGDAGIDLAKGEFIYKDQSTETA